MEFLELTFSRHDTCNLLCDTSLALAGSSPTRRYTGIITLFFNMLQLTRAAVTIDLASGVDCNIGNHFFADEFRPLDVDISKYFCIRNKAK